MSGMYKPSNRGNKAVTKQAANPAQQQQKHKQTATPCSRPGWATSQAAQAVTSISLSATPQESILAAAARRPFHLQGRHKIEGPSKGACLLWKVSIHWDSLSGLRLKCRLTASSFRARSSTHGRHCPNLLSCLDAALAWSEARST